MSFFFRSTTSTRAILRSTNTYAKINSINISIPVATRGFKSTASKMGVHNVNSKEEWEEALKSNPVVVLDAFATWCGPCKVIAPQVAKFSDEFPGAHFVKLDVDEVPDVAQELGIRAMPTFLIFKNEEKVREIVGANPKALLAAIQDAVKVE